MNLPFRRCKRFRIVNCGNAMRIDVRRLPKRTSCSPMSGCCSTAVRSSMRSYSADLTSVTPTLGVCSGRASTLRSIAPRVINMCMALAAALVAPRTRTSPATCVPGKCPAKRICEQNLIVFIIHRQLLLCRVALGKSFLQYSAMKMAHAPPGHHSVIGRPSAGGLHFAEYVVYRGEQVRMNE